MVDLFFDFYGIAIPFKPRVEDIEDIGDTNLLNQIIYSLLFLSSLICLLAKRHQVYQIIRKEKILTLFLLWCFISVIWSIDPLSTIKRGFRTLTLFMVTLSLLSHTTSTREILKYIKPIVYLYVFSSVAVCLTIPGAIDPQFHTWRGFTPHKNSLGQESVISIALCFFIFRREEGYKKIVAAIAVLFSIALLFGSGSVTSITSFLVVSLIGSIFIIDTIFKPIGLGRKASLLIILFFGSVAIFFVVGTPILLESLTKFAGKDLTFSGRTNLWAVLLTGIFQHLYLGVGYQAFWTLKNPAIMPIYDIFVWLPNEAHNGYIEIVNEVGLIGFIIFFSALVKYFLSLKKLKKTNPWKWIVIAALIINLQESAFFRPGHLVGEMIVIAYFILFSQLVTQEEKESYTFENG